MAGLAPSNWPGSNNVAGQPRGRATQPLRAKLYLEQVLAKMPILRA